ncbi:pentapeptide repeat protein [Nitzschia inconspicua]|uniref:Pentapeptide repeat protein n=1 Tax=Nitzschia inconspicua TaxID=303405 RepID=A0A9K3L3X2_9STRA|nr:pentapeptide repeat protein [Nitzschia inconspicua]
MLIRVDAFVAHQQCRFLATTQHQSHLQPLHSFWRHWIPETDFMQVLEASKHRPVECFSQCKTEKLKPNSAILSLRATMMMGALSIVILGVLPETGMAVSGGGLDYAGTDISGQNFSNSDYKGKDFTQVIAKGTNFAKSNLQGCRFYKAYLVNADFSDADIRGVSMEDTSMDGASLKNAIAAGSYFSASIVDTATVENADFTDAQFPIKSLPLLCDRPDMKGTNPVTGVNTRDSAMCP